MRDYIVLVILALLTAFTFYVVWMNRASEKIITAVVPIAIGALAGVLMAVFIFGGRTTTSVRFPAVFLYQLQTRAPITAPYRPLLNSLFEVPELQKNNPDAVNRDPDGQSLYHHLLQRSILDIWAQWHHYSWQTDIQRFDIGMNEAMGSPAVEQSARQRRFTFDEISTKLKGNVFANSPYGRPEISFPYGTDLQITPPPLPGANVPAIAGRIVLRNKFVVLTVETIPFGWLRGLGPYRSIMGYSWEQAEGFAHMQYLVTVTASYSRLRSGNPEMPKYKQWVDQLTSELRQELDEESLWSKTKENFLFQQQLRTAGVPTGPTPPATLRAPEYH